MLSGFFCEQKSHKTNGRSHVPGNNGVRDNYVFSLKLILFLHKIQGKTLKHDISRPTFSNPVGILFAHPNKFDMTERKNAKTRMTPTNCNESLKYYFFACKCFFQWFLVKICLSFLRSSPKMGSIIESNYPSEVFHPNPLGGNDPPWKKRQVLKQMYASHFAQGFSARVFEGNFWRYWIACGFIGGCVVKKVVLVFSKLVLPYWFAFFIASYHHENLRAPPTKNPWTL